MWASGLFPIIKYIQANLIKFLINDNWISPATCVTRLLKLTRGSCFWMEFEVSCVNDPMAYTYNYSPLDH